MDEIKPEFIHVDETIDVKVDDCKCVTSDNVVHNMENRDIGAYRYFDFFGLAPNSYASQLEMEQLNYIYTTLKGQGYRDEDFSMLKELTWLNAKLGVVQGTTLSKLYNYLKICQQCNNLQSIKRGMENI